MHLKTKLNMIHLHGSDEVPQIITLEDVHTLD